VDVDDVAAYLEKAKALGGKTLVPPVEIPTGTFAWMQDPEGNTVGLWEGEEVKQRAESGEREVRAR
jgi:predicted enzyme related to lactoylglutathione lyase